VILKNWNFFPKIEKLVELELEKNIFPNYSQFFSKKMTKFVGGEKKKKTWLMCVFGWGLFFYMK